MLKVTLKGFMIIPDSDLEAVERELLVHSELTLQEKGCIVFEVTKNGNNPNRYDVYEEFTGRAAFEAHQERVRNSHWGEVTVNVERCYDVFE